VAPSICSNSDKSESNRRRLPPVQIQRMRTHHFRFDPAQWQLKRFVVVRLLAPILMNVNDANDEMIAICERG
jgi:hypothetical protein